MLSLGEAWRPWRSVAARLFWHDYLSRRVSRRDLDEMHDAVRKAAIKDQEAAGVDVVSDGEAQRDNMIVVPKVVE